MVLACDEVVPTDEDSAHDGDGGEHGSREGDTGSGGGGYFWDENDVSASPDLDRDDGNSSSGSSAPSVEYDATKCHLTVEAAEAEVGKLVAERFKNGIIYVGEVTGVDFVPASESEPSHYMNLIRWSDDKVDRAWKPRLQKGIRLHRDISLTYGRRSHDGLNTPPCYSGAYSRWANGTLAWCLSGQGMRRLPVELNEPSPVHVAGESEDVHDVPAWSKRRTVATVLGHCRYPGHQHDTYLVEVAASGEKYAMRGKVLLDAIEKQALSAIPSNMPTRPSTSVRPPSVASSARPIAKRSDEYTTVHPEVGKRVRVRFVGVSGAGSRKGYPGEVTAVESKV